MILLVIAVMISNWTLCSSSMVRRSITASQSTVTLPDAILGRNKDANDDSLESESSQLQIGVGLGGIGLSTGFGGYGGGFGGGYGGNSGGFNNHGHGGGYGGQGVSSSYGPGRGGGH